MCASGTPGYVPPVANFDGESPDGVILSPAPPVKTKKGSQAQPNIFDFMLIKQNSQN